MHVKSSFLNRLTDDEVYVKEPPGFEETSIQTMFLIK